MSEPCHVIEIFSIKVSSNSINAKVRPVFKIIDNHPLLDWIIPTDFKAFGIAFVISERGISRNTYITKKNTKAPIELYCNPNILKNMYSKKVIPSKIINTIDVHIAIVLTLFILNSSSH